MRLPWRRLLAALSLTAAVMVPTAAASAPAAASAASVPSSGWNDFSCRPSAQHPRPVVLVHGTFANGTDNWLVLAPYLVDRGYCVYSFDYGLLPGVPLIGGLGPITDSAQQLSDFTDRVLAASGAAKVDIEVTTMSAHGRRTTKRSGVDPKNAPRPLVVSVAESG